jgi:hypothetical protein
MSRPAAKPVAATVRESVQARDGGWRLLVRIDGSKVTALVGSPRAREEGERVSVVGSGSVWSLA